MAEAATRKLVCACPACGTRFRVTESALAIAAGQVRCGACLTVFDGRAALVESTPPEAAVAATEPDAAEAEPAPATARPSVPLWAAAYVALAITLAVLIGLLQWPAWSQDPILRGAYETACRAVGCELPPLAALHAVDAQSSVEAARAGAPAPLVIDAKLTSRAPFRQPYPALIVTFRDAGGSVVREQRLAPRQYRPPDALIRLAPNRAVRFTAALEDPGADATTYTLSLSTPP